MTRGKITIAVILLVTLFFSVAAMWELLTLRAANAPITDLAQYQTILAQLRKPNALSAGMNMLAYFPPAIPGDAQNPRMFYRPQYWQSGTVLQLRYQLPPDQIAAIQAQVSPIARQTTQGSTDEFSEVNSHHGLPTADFSVTDKPGAALPDDFSVYVVDAGSRPPPVEPWGSGYCYGVAISPQRSEVIYWLEDW
jgi:hypothetical protein